MKNYENLIISNTNHVPLSYIQKLFKKKTITGKEGGDDPLCLLGTGVFRRDHLLVGTNTSALCGFSRID
jgi:hypothetical protein